MAAVDLGTQVQAFLRRARTQADPKGWLDELHEQATLAVAAGDQFVTLTRFEGVDSAMERKVMAVELLQIAELGLQQLEAEEAAETETAPGFGANTYGDFSDTPSDWG